MILSDKADLLHVEKVHLALRGREKKKRKNKNIHTKVTAVAVYSQKEEKSWSKKTSKDRFSQLYLFRKRDLQVSFSALLVCDF